MIASSDLIQGIVDTIQRVYGDATQTVLDQRAAHEIWRYLTDHGMASPEFVAAMVVAAGGEIVVSDRDVVGLDQQTEIFVVPELGTRRLIVRVRERA